MDGYQSGQLSLGDKTCAALYSIYRSLFSEWLVRRVINREQLRWVE